MGTQLIMKGDHVAGSSGLLAVQQRGGKMSVKGRAIGFAGKMESSFYKYRINWFKEISHLVNNTLLTLNLIPFCSMS